MDLTYTYCFFGDLESRRSGASKAAVATQETTHTNTIEQMPSTDAKIVQVQRQRHQEFSWLMRECPFGSCVQ